MDQAVLTPMHNEHNSRSIRFENSRALGGRRQDYDCHLL